MWRYVKLFHKFFLATTMSNLTYKADFIAWSIVTIGWFIWSIVFYEVLFTQVNQIAGWDKSQVLVLQGFYFLTEFVIWGIVYANISDLPRRIVTGQLDGDLMKPVSTQFLLSGREINQNQINSLFLGIGTIIYGLTLDNTSVSFGNLIFASIVFFIGCIFLYGGYFATVCLAFWFDRLDNITYPFPELRHFAKVPYPAYSGIAKIAFTYVIPITLVTALPSQFLFGEPQWGLVAWLSLVSLFTLWLSHFTLKRGLLRYHSASS